VVGDIAQPPVLLNVLLLRQGLQDGPVLYGLQLPKLKEEKRYAEAATTRSPLTHMNFAPPSRG
jgi:hypothetical protein